jgi:hypothetical protein
MYSVLSSSTRREKEAKAKGNTHKGKPRINSTNKKLPTFHVLIDDGRGFQGGWEWGMNSSCIPTIS